MPIYVAALNMRAGQIAITPIITVIGIDLGLSTIELSWLASIPVLCFAFASPLTSWVSRMGSVDRILSVAMWVLAFSLVLRATGSVIALYVFTFVMGLAIATLNVFLPAWVKEYGGKDSGLFTGIYVTIMGVVSGIAVGVSVPLSKLNSLGWQMAFVPWALIAAISAYWWQRRMRDQTLSKHTPNEVSHFKVLIKSKVAWQVTLFFGLQSTNAYAAGTWRPTILYDKGFELIHAGAAVAVTGLLGSLFAVGVPHIAAKRADQRLVLVIATGFAGIGFLGVMLDSGWRLVIWIMVASIGTSATFPLALILVVLRSSDSNHAQALSAMMQSFGYFLAATGPIFMGVLYQISGAWTFGLAVMILISGVQILAGLGAAKSGTA